MSNDVLPVSAATREEMISLLMASTEPFINKHVKAILEDILEIARKALHPALCYDSEVVEAYGILIATLITPFTTWWMTDTHPDPLPNPEHVEKDIKACLHPECSPSTHVQFVLRVPDFVTATEAESDHTLVPFHFVVRDRKGNAHTGATSMRKVMQEYGWSKEVAFGYGVLALTHALSTVFNTALVGGEWGVMLFRFPVPQTSRTLQQPSLN